jgi:hypothetical protein
MKTTRHSEFWKQHFEEVEAQRQEPLPAADLELVIAGFWAALWVGIILLKIWFLQWAWSMSGKFVQYLSQLFGG